MVDDESAEAAYDALKMVIAGLAEQALELAAASSPATAQGRVAEMRRLTGIGEDLSLAAGAAAMALGRAYPAAAGSESPHEPL
jgi:hypothetical protein